MGPPNPDPEAAAADDSTDEDVPVRFFVEVLEEECLLKGEFHCVLPWSTVRDAFPCCFVVVDAS